MNTWKHMAVTFRNALAFGYSWIVLCTVLVAALSGRAELSVRFLLQLLALCIWGALCFTACFANEKMQKKGFIFSLTIFFGFFIPGELVMFYFMGLFTNAGAFFWSLLAILILGAYVGSILVDLFIMKKKGEKYSEKLSEYVAKRRED